MIDQNTKKLFGIDLYIKTRNISKLDLLHFQDKQFKWRLMFIEAEGRKCTKLDPAHRPTANTSKSFSRYRMIE